MSLLVILIPFTLILVLWYKLYSPVERRTIRVHLVSLKRCVMWNLIAILRVLMKKWQPM